jgi:hypothetical protein
MEGLEWIKLHWAEIAAAFGIGGSSGLLGKKAMDSKQDKEIKQLCKKVDVIEKEVSENKAKLELNTTLDKQLREDLNRDFTRIDQKLDRLVDLMIKK